MKSSLSIRHALTMIITIGTILASYPIIYGGLSLLAGCEYPIRVVISGSMEPGIKRGDVFVMSMSNAPIRAGEIVVFEVDGQEISVVHRVIEVHERGDAGEVDILTKGDANNVNDRFHVYPHGQLWLQKNHIVGRVVCILPYLGWAALGKEETIKYVVSGVSRLLSFFKTSW